MTLLHRTQFAQPFAYPLLGIVAYGTGVDEHKIGLLYRLREAVARRHKDGTHHLTVGKIHLTTIRFYVYLLHRTI